MRIVVIGELDAASAPLLRAEVDQALDRLDEGGVLTIDLGSVSFLDSWGSLPLEAALAGTGQRGAALVLARPSTRVLLVLSILGWDVVVTPVDTGASGASGDTVTHGAVRGSVRGDGARARWVQDTHSLRSPPTAVT